MKPDEIEAGQRAREAMKDGYPTYLSAIVT
jgi:hypothetical protein